MKAYIIDHMRPTQTKNPWNKSNSLLHTTKPPLLPCPIDLTQLSGHPSSHAHWQVKATGKLWLNSPHPSLVFLRLVSSSRPAQCHMNNNSVSTLNSAHIPPYTEPAASSNPPCAYSYEPIPQSHTLHPIKPKHIINPRFPHT